jgi:fatty acid synthase
MGVIPPNINFKKHRSGIKAFENGTLRVVTEPTIWKPGLVGINSFGFGGSNVHVLLRCNQKEKVNKGIPDDHLPRLVVMSGRTEQAVESFLNEVFINFVRNACRYIATKLISYINRKFIYDRLRIDQ